MYKSKSTATHSVPIPVFQELAVGHRVDLTVALHVYPRVYKSKKKKPTGILMILGCLAPINPKTGQRVRKEYMLPPQCDIDPEWLMLVAEYLGYAVRRWKSLGQARRWCRDHRSTFMRLVQDIWQHMGGGVHPVSRFWSIRPSVVPPDRKYVEAGWFNPEEGPGSGLFCVKEGQHVIYFDGPDSVTERIGPPVKKSQGRYIAGIPKSKEVYAPTMMALKVGVVHSGFIVQHCRNNPTHKADYDSHVGRPCLFPVRPVKTGEEFTFDYGWEETEDVESEEDSNSDGSSRVDV